MLYPAAASSMYNGSVDGMLMTRILCSVAYIRFLDGENSLYDMTDVELETKQPGEPGEPGKPEESETPGSRQKMGMENPKSTSMLPSPLINSPLRKVMC